MKRVFFVLLGCCLLPALVWGADAARWEQLMEEGRRAGVMGYSGLLYGDWHAAVRAFTAAVKEAEGFGPTDPRLADSLDALAQYYLHNGGDCKIPSGRHYIWPLKIRLGENGPCVSTKLSKTNLCSSV